MIDIVKPLPDPSTSPDDTPLLALIVDGDPVLSRHYAELLETEGLSCRTAATPAEALACLAGFEPDIAIVDHHMPEMDCARLAAWIRQDGAMPEAAILLLSADHQASKLASCIESGAEFFLAKPVDAAIFRALVRSQAAKARQLKEQRLRLSASQRESQFLKLALDQHAIVSMTDSHGKILYVNRKFIEISGYAEDELIGRNHRILKSGVHPYEFYAKLWQTISAGKIWHGDVCNLGKNGKPYWVHATIMPMLDGNGLPERYVSIRTDITALKDAEQALQESEFRWKFALEGSGEGVWDWDMKSGQITYSARSKQMLGYEENEIGNTLEAWRKLIDPADIAPAVTALDAHLQGKTESYHAEYRIICKDGDSKWLLSRGMVVSRDRTGKPLRVIGTHADITRRKQIEQLLIEARDEAESANRAKSEFLSSMSHELRTPLNAILGYAQLLEMDNRLSGKNGEAVRHDAHEILTAGQQLLALIDDVLDLAKIEGGHMAVSLEPVLLRNLFTDCKLVTSAMAEIHSVELAFDQASCMGMKILADTTRLRQVLLNFISNAIKYNRPGGSVQVLCRQSDHHLLRIEVTDTGPGIPEEKLTRLFVPFERLGAEMGTVEGTGIGLVITQRLVTLMGGRLGVESRVGVGSTFWVELPIVSAAEENSPASALSSDSPAQKPQPATKQVLYIEDNSANLGLMRKVFSKRTHLNLVDAPSAELGLPLARSLKPDLILLDINLPGLDGYQALTELRKIDGLQTTPVIAVTANAMKGDAERGRKAGFAAYISKPLDIAQFLAQLDVLLGDGTGGGK